MDSELDFERVMSRLQCLMVAVVYPQGDAALAPGRAMMAFQAVTRLVGRLAGFVLTP